MIRPPALFADGNDISSRQLFFHYLPTLLRGPLPVDIVVWRLRREETHVKQGSWRSILECKNGGHSPQTPRALVTLNDAQDIPSLRCIDRNAVMG